MTGSAAVHVTTQRRHYTGRDGQERVYETHLLRRSWREGGKVRNETVANLSKLPPETIELIRRSLAGERFIPAGAAAQVARSLPHGHAAAVHAMARKLGFPGLLGPPGRDRDLAYALVLSRLHPKKGIEVLIEAFIAMKFDRWRLIIAGDGPTDYVARLKRKAAAAGDKISFRGWVDGDEKEELLGHASLLVLPSYQENFGLCVMEALARSVPVLISPHVNLANEIESAKAGWIAPVEVPALSATLAEALGNPGELAERGRAGKRLSLNYSWERVATDLSKLYAEITNGGAGIH